MKTRIIRIFVFLLIGMGIGLGMVYMKDDKALEGEITELGENVSILKKPVSAPIAGDDSNQALQTAIGGPFTLVDQNGQTVTQDNYKDSYKLIFFGFTYCPAICPTELEKVKKVLDGLGPTADKIQPILISVDPARDTPERLKEYVTQFHPRQIGLTGTQEQIDAATQSFRIYASKVENEHMEGYMFDHSAFLYLMSPENTLVSVYPSSETAENIITDIKGRNF